MNFPARGGALCSMSATTIDSECGNPEKTGAMQNTFSGMPLIKAQGDLVPLPSLSTRLQLRSLARARRRNGRRVRRPQENPATGRECGGVPAPLSFGGSVGAAGATLPAVPCSVSKRPSSLSPTRKPRRLTQRVAGFWHSRRSNKQCEQLDHADSDHEHCECYGIVVQTVQPLLHDTPPCSRFRALSPDG
jgi:hypothetical protein